MDHNNDYTPPFGNKDEITPPNENPSDITEATANELPSANSAFSSGTAQTGVDQNPASSFDSTSANTSLSSNSLLSDKSFCPINLSFLKINFLF